MAVDWSRRAGSVHLIHLVNYKTSATVLNAVVKLRVPAGKRLREVIAESPDAPAVRLNATAAGGFATVTLPKLDLYSVLVFRMEDP